MTEAVELAWHVREGLLGLVGKQRPQGSMLIVEDVCFPPARLAEGARDLQALLAKHGFIPGVAGHAAHGNLHFTLVARLDEPEGRARYSAFMNEVVDLVVKKHDGSLKAEHGTGLNMAPFVDAEWGEKAAEMMWRIKALADPQRRPGAQRHPYPRPGDPSQGAEVGAGDRGCVWRQPLHRVRLLRAHVPEPQRHHDAAPEDRASP